MRAGRLLSRAVIRRPVEERGPLGSVVTVYPQVGTAWVEVRVPRRMLANYGAGEMPTGTMEAELRDRIDVQMRDVLVVVAGPEIGTRWRVESPPHRPGRGETLVLLSVFNDPLNEGQTG